VTQGWAPSSQALGGISQPLGGPTVGDQMQGWLEPAQPWENSSPTERVQGAGWPELSQPLGGGPAGTEQSPNNHYVSQLEELSPWNADSRPMQTWTQSSGMLWGNNNNVNPAQWAASSQSPMPTQISYAPTSGQFTFVPPQNRPPEGQQTCNRLVIMVSAATVGVVLVCTLLGFAIFSNPQTAGQSANLVAATATSAPTATPTPWPTDTPTPVPPTPTTASVTANAPVYIPPTPFPVTPTAIVTVPTPTPKPPVTASMSTPAPTPTITPTATSTAKSSKSKKG
jgi:hypothetical protein